LTKKDQSDLVRKGLVGLRLDNEMLSTPLRLLLAQSIPSRVKSVRFSVPASAQGKVMFNLVRLVLDVRNFDSASVIDLQRLQINSQMLAVVRPSSIDFASLITNRLRVGSPFLASLNIMESLSFFFHQW
jgi:hypothetical protein